TYNNSQINAVDMNKENLDSSNLCVYPLINEQNINLVN
ncbi:MAG: choloylglycine hydrolase, partial [Peptacetobacter hiranonis]|nr:choloylglycine hydrolase [Peptacetobacter hiranonis]